MSLKVYIKRILNQKVGLIKQIVNKERRIGESLSYVSIWVIDDYGNEKCLLFTDNEIKIAESRTQKNQEDIN